MPSEEHLPEAAYVPPLFDLGLEVVDKDGKKLGKVEARFSRYILVERGGLFVKVYYVPHAAISSFDGEVLHLSYSEEDLRKKEYHRVPDDLYIETPEPGITDLSGVAQFARGPLSPAETGHYNYGKRYPGINTDASGSYHREEVAPQPQKYVGESTKIFSTELPIEPQDINSN